MHRATSPNSTGRTSQSDQATNTASADPVQDAISRLSDRGGVFGDWSLKGQGATDASNTIIKAYQQAMQSGNTAEAQRLGGILGSLSGQRQEVKDAFNGAQQAQATTRSDAASQALTNRADTSATVGDANAKKAQGFGNSLIDTSQAGLAAHLGPNGDAMYAKGQLPDRYADLRPGVSGDYASQDNLAGIDPNVQNTAAGLSDLFSNSQADITNAQGQPIDPHSFDVTDQFGSRVNPWDNNNPALQAQIAGERANLGNQFDTSANAIRANVAARGIGGGSGLAQQMLLQNELGRAQAIGAQTNADTINNYGRNAEWDTQNKTLSTGVQTGNANRGSDLARFNKGNALNFANLGLQATEGHSRDQLARAQASYGQDAGNVQRQISLGEGQNLNSQQNLNRKLTANEALYGEQADIAGRRSGLDQTQFENYMKANGFMKDMGTEGLSALGVSNSSLSPGNTSAEAAATNSVQRQNALTEQERLQNDIDQKNNDRLQAGVAGGVGAVEKGAEIAVTAAKVAPMLAAYRTSGGTDDTGTQDASNGGYQTASAPAPGIYGGQSNYSSAPGGGYQNSQQGDQQGSPPPYQYQPLNAPGSIWQSGSTQQAPTQAPVGQGAPGLAGTYRAQGTQRGGGYTSPTSNYFG